MFLGTQVKIDKPLLKSIEDVTKNGGNVVQIFLRKMHSSSVKNRLVFSEEEEKEIKKFIKKNKIKGFVHGSYLLNFCRVPEGLIRIQWAYKILEEDMTLGEKLGMKGVVIHMCSRNAVDEKWKPVTLTHQEAIRRNIKHIEYFFKNYGKKLKIKLLLENSSSEGNKIGGNLLEFGKVFKPLYKKYGKRIGTCIDTCHAFASGYPLNTILGMKNFLIEYKKHVGSYSTISLIHLNDSLDVLGSKKDRHAAIGKGYIFKTKEGKEALCFLVSFAIKNKIPMCLETNSGYKRELGLIRKTCISKLKGGGKEVTKEEIIEILKEFQEYHKSLGNNIKATQYTRAIQSLEHSSIKKIKSGSELLDLLWIGKGIISKVDEYIKTGKVKLLEEFRKNPLISSSKELTSVFGIGPKKAKLLIDNGIYSVDDLKKAVNKGNVKLTRSQKIGLKYYDDLQKRIPRVESEKIKELIEKEFKKVFGSKGSVDLAGSYRMGKKTSGDVDIVLSLKKIKTTNGILKRFVKHLFEHDILVDTLSGSKIPGDKNSNYIGIIQLKNNPARHIDLHLIKSEDFPFHMLYFGSGEQFSRKIRKEAKEKGYKLNDKGLFKKGSKTRISSIKTERNVFKVLGMNWVQPEKRS